MSEPRTSPDVDVDTHQGADEWGDTEPELEPDDVDPRVCHLIDSTARSLCGIPGAFGIPCDSPRADESPCTCGRARCDECVANL